MKPRNWKAVFKSIDSIESEQTNTCLECLNTGLISEHPCLEYCDCSTGCALLAANIKRASALIFKD